MLGFSMLALAFLIAAMLALFFFAVVVTSFQYEKAKRDEYAKPKRSERNRRVLSGDGELIDFPTDEDAQPDRVASEIRGRYV